MELGSAEEQRGLRATYAQKLAEFQKKKDDKEKAERELENKLNKKATQLPDGIKHNPMYKDANYNTPKIRQDIQYVIENSIEPMSEEKRHVKETELHEGAMPNITKRVSFDPKLQLLQEETSHLVNKSIKPNEPIQELLNDAILQQWVKDGIPHHRGKRNTCAFCGQTLPTDLWKKLDQHFSRESSELEEALQNQINKVKQHMEETTGLSELISPEDFYSTYKENAKNVLNKLSKEVASYVQQLQSLENVLSSRLNDIFKPKSVPELQDNSQSILEEVNEINSLIEHNNAKTDSLEEDHNLLRTELRLNEVAQFVRYIDYENEISRINALEDEVENSRNELKDLNEKINSFQSEIDHLRTQLNDEKRAVEKINEYLNHAFGHEGIRLVAKEEGSAHRFKVFRGESLAYNLSEGECSLIAFCYFMAKLSDSDSQGKKLTIFIDDPVSSLDNNHLFFVYSLIEALIARPLKNEDGQIMKDEYGKNLYPYEQLFISTHNLEFLQYLKRLPSPKKDREHFIIAFDQTSSTIKLMPGYLRNYITEFNYLFGEIYKCNDPTNAETEYYSFYNFGNNLRKFLEVYLFFKYPFSVEESQDFLERTSLFFQDDTGAEALIKRITNEYSHLSSMPERCTQPIDKSEISRAAQFILKKLKEIDPYQFDCLLQSINQSDPFVA